MRNTLKIKCTTWTNVKTAYGTRTKQYTDALMANDDVGGTSLDVLVTQYNNQPQ